ncbi:unnamed protein product, partial [Polarella glacialis]
DVAHCQCGNVFAKGLDFCNSCGSKRIDAAEEQDFGGNFRMRHVIESRIFRIFVSTVIFANTAMTGALMQQKLDELKSGNMDKANAIEGTTEIVDLCFNIFFLFELILRLSAYHRSFWRGREWKWNLFDSFLIVQWIFDQILHIAGNGVGGLTFSFIRILRILRFARVLRIIR